jgi:hypothetical protein
MVWKIYYKKLGFKLIRIGKKRNIFFVQRFVNVSKFKLTSVYKPFLVDGTRWKINFSIYVLRRLMR